MTNPNEPAYPTLGNVGHNSDWQVEHGFTKREQFAKDAMQGLCLNRNTWDIQNGQANDIAISAVIIADALIAALNQKGADHE